MRTAAASALLLLLAPALAAAQPQEDSYAWRVATMLARKVAVDYLDEREIKLEDPQFEVAAQAVEPGERVQASIKEMRLGPNEARLQLEIDATFRLAGKLRRGEGEEPIAVSGVGDARLSVTAVARWIDPGENPSIRVQVEELACELQEVRELTPADLPDAKQLVHEGFTRNADAIRDDLNAHLAENEIRPSEAEE